MSLVDRSGDFGGHSMPATQNDAGNILLTTSMDSLAVVFKKI